MLLLELCTLMVMELLSSPSSSDTELMSAVDALATDSSIMMASAEHHSTKSEMRRSCAKLVKFHLVTFHMVTFHSILWASSQLQINV